MKYIAQNFIFTIEIDYIIFQCNNFKIPWYVYVFIA